MNLCVRNTVKRVLFGGGVRYSTAVETVDPVEPDLTEEEVIAKQVELEQKRNKSGLSKAHFNLINNRVPYETAECGTHATVKYHRKLFGKYGFDSGVNPSLCWPTKKDIEETKEFESVKYPFSIQEMMVNAAQKREDQRELIIQTEKNLAEKYSKLETWKKQLADRIEKKTAETIAAKEKKDRLVEEVRRHFGFKIDPHDERFQEMMVKREKEQKKLEKQARREAKEKRLLAKLQEANSEISETTK